MKRPANTCDCGQPATTTHAGGKCCEECKRVVAQAQAEIDERIKKFRSGCNEDMAVEKRRIAERKRTTPELLAKKRARWRKFYRNNNGRISRCR